MRQFLCFGLIIATLIESAASFALDVVKLPQTQSELDVRFNYKNELLGRALTLTVEEYGEFEIQMIGTPMMRNRAQAALHTGTLINVYFSPASENLNKNTIPIKIPIRRGILSYRLLLIHQADIPLFAKVKTAEDLKKLTAGLQNEWITTAIMADAGFKIRRAQTYDGLFLMLENRRFHYIPRGIHEIYDELAVRKAVAPDVVVEPNLALYMIMPTYTYVSPAEPRLARRLEAGLTKMVENGDLEALFNRHYADDIAKAKLSGRTIIEINNPSFNDYSLLENKKLWFTPAP